MQATFHVIHLYTARLDTKFAHGCFYRFNPFGCSLTAFDIVACIRGAPDNIDTIGTIFKGF